MMHSFQMMYNTMGSKVDGLAVREHYLSKNALKTAILADTILDHLTSERASTRAQRVPDTRPEPEVFVDTRTRPDFFSKSSGISGIGYSRKF